MPFALIGMATWPPGCVLMDSIAQDIFLKLHKNNHLYEDAVEQLWCENDQRYGRQQ